MKRCPKNCSSVLPQPSDTYCYKCGATLVDSRKCGCGYELSEVDNFCPTCGRPSK